MASFMAGATGRLLKPKGLPDTVKSQKIGLSDGYGEKVTPTAVLLGYDDHGSAS